MSHKQSRLTKRSRFTIRLHREACWVADNTVLETRAKSPDARLPLRTDFNTERTLGNRLASVQDIDYVRPGFLRLVDALERYRIDTPNADSFLGAAWTDDLDVQVAFAGATSVDLEVGVVVDSDSFRLDAATGRVTFACIDG